MFYIEYPINFQENKVKALIHSSDIINVIILTEATKLDLIIRKTSVKAQKIDSSQLETYDIVLANFLL